MAGLERLPSALCVRARACVPQRGGRSEGGCVEREAASAGGWELGTIRKPRRVAEKAPNTPPLPKSLRWGLRRWRRGEATHQVRKRGSFLPGPWPSV